MKNLIFLIVFLLCLCIVNAQNIKPSIQVTGSAELEIEPDEILFEISIKEYWVEEFKKGKDYDDYKTKVPMKEIEPNILKALGNIGINKNQITVNDIGNYWRHMGKEFLLAKKIVISVKEFSMINKIIESIDPKGIESMRIAELKNKNISEFRKKVKTEALKAAQDKASYLLSSLNKQIGDIISIKELTNGDSALPYFFGGSSSMSSNSIMSSIDDSGIDNLRKIKLRYEIVAEFEIK